ncbi:MAG TPA: hypothetical protein VMW56_07280 [Candidatus Margulisiibacteriota bacterium]|nr:hypothetical protein [Candidatus Margulisiibacteriota bacterium]
MKGQAARARKSAGKRPQSARLTQMVVFDALRSWVIPSVAGAVAFALYVLYNIELVSADVAVTTTGALALLVLLFFGLRGFFEDLPEGWRLAVLAGFAVLWCAVTFYPFYRAVNPGTPLFSAELKSNGPPVTIPLHDKPGRYSLYVLGHFLPAEGRENRAATYHIALGHDGGTDRLIVGSFHQEWGSQRVGSGRRSSLVPVMHESSIVIEPLDDPEGRDLTMQLKDIEPGVRDSVTVRIYPPGVPVPVLIGLGVLTVAVALIIDAWRAKGESEGLLGTLTVAALVAVAVFRGSTVATPGFGQLVVGALVGALGGALGGSLLARLVRPLRKYVQ